MGYVNNLKENNVVFDIQDKRIAQVSSSDADKVLRVLNDGNIAAFEIRPEVISISLPTASWVGTTSPFTQGITITGSTANSKVDLQPNASVLALMLTDKCNAIYIENNNNVLTAYAVGKNKPSVNLTIQATMSEVVL